MPIALITITKPPQTHDAKSMAAVAFFREYLQRNLYAAQTLSALAPLIEEFKGRMPVVIASKCIDGRVHGSKAKGYPPTTIAFFRSEGNNVFLDESNTQFWTRIDRAVIDAQCHTPGMPALFITLGHRAMVGGGCAAHGGDDAKALEAVHTQATVVRGKYRSDALYVLYGMTNTDDMSERLIFEEGTVSDTAEIIALFDAQGMHLREAVDIFAPQFLAHPIDDSAIARHVGNLTPAQLFAGHEATVYRNFSTAIAIETFLSREICQAVHHPDAQQQIVNPAFYTHVHTLLENVKGLPKSLIGPLLFQITWNAAYTLHQRRRVQAMKAEDRLATLEHAEDLACYGDGFETLSRNLAVLVKTGRGDDVVALNVAKKVLAHNREHRPRPFPFLVHANVEMSGILNNWNAFNDQVLSKLMTMLRAVYACFGTDMHILTTYSYKNQKRFYPVDVQLHTADSCMESVYPLDIAQGLNKRNFTEPEQLHLREQLYAQSGFLQQTGAQ